MVDWLMKRIKGYTTIKVDGLSIERVINLLLNQGIKVSGIKRHNYTSLLLTVSALDERKAVKHIEEKGYAYKIKKRGGVPALIYGVRKRYALIASFLLIIASLIFLSQYVWIVEIDGIKDMDQSKIEQVLIDNGLTAGALKRSLDKDKIENQLMIKLPELAWTGIEIKGIKVIVRIAELEKVPEIQDKVTPSDIVADFDGTITKVVCLQGTALVKEGDVVKKGQMLIRGANKNGVKAAALGQIYADVWRKTSGAALLYDTVSVRTGNSVSVRYYSIGQYNLSDDKLEIPYTHYEAVTQSYYIGGKMLAGLKLTVKNAYEIEYVTNQINAETAKALALKRAQEKMDEQMKDAPIKYSNVIYNTIDGKLITAEMFVCTNVNIAKQIKAH